MVLSIIVTCYKKDPTPILEAMKKQTLRDKQVLVFCSNIDIGVLKKKYKKFEFFDVPNRKDWGHSKRAMGLAFAEGKYLCFVNDDDEYEPIFAEFMVKVLEKAKADLAYCVWKDKTLKGGYAQPGLKKGGITSGSFVVRTDKAQKIGWKHRLYASDWYFIRELLKEGVQVVYLPHSLMKHN